MINKFNFYIAFCFVVFSFLLGCNSKKETETILTGTTSVLVDETILPVVEDQVQVFESKYKATVNLISKSEAECLNSITNDSAKILVLARKLSEAEVKYFTNKKIIPRETPFATDAIALIRNKKSKDTLIELSSVTDYIQGKPSIIKGLVFDNPNSSSVSMLLKMVNMKSLPKENIFSFKTSNEVIKYCAENEGFVGVIGINWIAQPSIDMESDIAKINVLSVKGAQSADYFYPSQDNIAAGNYPLARDLYIINCQGYEGLGMGFSSFVAGQIGQRIILKSGLVPFKMPGRNIRIVK